MTPKRRDRLRHLVEQFPHKSPTEEELDYLYEYTSEALTFYETLELLRSRQMSVKYAIMCVDPGKVPPKEFLEPVANEFDTGYGLAVCVDGQMILQKEACKVNIPSLVTNLEALKDSFRMLWFAKSTDKLLDEDLQPYVLVGDTNNPQIIACIGGNFDEYAMTGSSHTAEYHAIDKRIRPKTLKLWKGEGSDMESFFKTFIDENDDDLRDELDALCPENSSVIYMFAHERGAVLYANKPDTREKEIEWGSVFGAPAPEAVPETQVGKKIISLANMGTKKPEEKKDISNGKYTDVKTQKQVLGEKEFPFTLALQENSDVPITVGDADLVICPPADRDNKDRVTSWYKEQIGYVPHNWKQRPWIKPKAQGTIKLGDLKSSTASVTKDAGNKYVPPPKTMSPNVVKDFMNTHWPEIKVLGNNSEAIAHPDKIMSDEEKDLSAAMMLAAVDPSFKDKTIRDLDLFHAGRARLIYLCSSPGSLGDQYMALVNSLWRDNMFERIRLDKKVAEQANRISNLEEQLSKAKPAEPEKATGTGGTINLASRIKR